MTKRQVFFLFCILTIICVATGLWFVLRPKQKTENMTTVVASSSPSPTVPSTNIISLDNNITENVTIPLNDVSIQHGTEIYHNFVPNTLYSIIECDKNSPMRSIVKKFELQPTYGVLPSQTHNLLVDINPYNTENIFGLGGGQYSLLTELCVKNICMDFTKQQIVFNSHPNFKILKQYKSESPNYIAWNNAKLILLNKNGKKHELSQKMFMVDNTIDCVCYQMDGKQGSPYPEEYYITLDVSGLIYDDITYNIDERVVCVDPSKISPKDFPVTIFGKKFLELFKGLYYTFSNTGDIDQINLY